MTQTDKMLSRKEGGVGYLTFNNPERHNAVSLEMWERPPESSRISPTTTMMRVVVITGAGGKAFVSGADISKFERRALQQGRRSTATTQRSIAANDAVYEISQADHRDDPRLLHRRRRGAGAVLRHAHLLPTIRSSACRPAKLGLGYRYAGLKKLVDLVGPSFAKEIFFTARQFTPRRRSMMGLVNRVLPDAELESYVKNYAETIAGNAPLTVKSVKFIVGQAVRDESKRDLETMR